MISANRGPLYQRCMRPVYDIQKQELSARIKALRSENRSTQKLQTPTIPVVFYTVPDKSGIRSYIAKKREYSYDFMDPTVSSMRVVAAFSASFYDLTVDELYKACREVNHVDARHAAFLVISTHTNRSLPEIGRVFGGRDHTTVLSGIRRAQKRIWSGDQKFREAFDYIRGNVFSQEQYYWAA